LLNGSAVELHVLGFCRTSTWRELFAFRMYCCLCAGTFPRVGAAPLRESLAASRWSLLKEQRLRRRSPSRTGAVFTAEKGRLGDVLVRVLKDEHYRTSLHKRSWLAHAQYFSWHAIAARYSEFMNQ